MARACLESNASDGLWPQAVATAADSSSTLSDRSAPPGVHDLADRAAHQASDGAEAGELDPFLPHLLHDVRRQTCVESRSLQRRVERLQSRRPLAVSLAIDKLLEVGELDNATLIVDLGRNDTDPTDDSILSEPLRQEIDVAHAVEHWKDHRFLSKGGGEIVHRRLERIGFYAEED